MNTLKLETSETINSMTVYAKAAVGYVKIAEAEMTLDTYENGDMRVRNRYSCDSEYISQHFPEIVLQGIEKHFGSHIIDSSLKQMPFALQKFKKDDLECMKVAYILQAMGLTVRTPYDAKTKSVTEKLFGKLPKRS